MNKYQKAEAWIKEIDEHPDWGHTSIDWEAIDQLKELIDNYDKLEKKHKLAIEELSCGKCPESDPNCNNFKNCTECWDYILYCNYLERKHKLALDE